MCKQKWFIFFFITSICIAKGQIVDDFSDLSHDLSTFWLGDRSDFEILPGKLLGLIGSSKGISSLYTISQWQDDQEWEMYFQLDFDPSANNRLEIYLWSDNPNLSEGTGVLVRIGENGNQDALTMYFQENGQRIELGRGTLGLAGRGPLTFRLRASILGENILLDADQTGGMCFEKELDLPVSQLLKGSEFYFGWTCIYTPSRKNLFFFDDVYVGSKRKDLMSPVISNITTDVQNVILTLDEPIDPLSLNNTIFSLLPNPGNLDISLDKNELTLSSSGGFDHTTEYHLGISGLSDFSGNMVDTVILFVVPVRPLPGSILINEVLFNPFNFTSDFIELYNNSDGYLDINNITLSNERNGDQIILDHIPIIDKGEYVVLTESRKGIINQYPSHAESQIFEIDLPGLNSSDGNISLALDGIILDEFDYDEDFHHPLIDNIKGISLERISFIVPTNDPQNWTSALPSSGYGTPGLPNSIIGKVKSQDNLISLEDTVFSPNSDGDKDELVITYNLNAKGYIGTFEVYNDRGKLIREIVKNEILSSSGKISWDGRNQNGKLAPLGIYIIHAHLFNLDGDRFQKKLSCGLGDFLN